MIPNILYNRGSRVHVWVLASATSTSPRTNQAALLGACYSLSAADAPSIASSWTLSQIRRRSIASNGRSCESCSCQRLDTKVHWFDIMIMISSIIISAAIAIHIMIISL